MVQWQDLNPGQKGNDGIPSILGGLNYYIHGDDLKVMVNYVHTWSDFEFRQILSMARMSSINSSLACRRCSSNYRSY